MKKAIAEIKEQCGLADADVQQNFILMGLAGLSDNTLVKNVYPLVIILFLLVLIRRRADDFGQPEQHDRPADAVLRHDALRRHEQTAGRPLRAAGGTKLVQNSRADRRVGLGTCLAWGLNAVLRYLVGGEFSEIPVFGVSAVGIVSGAVLGVLTVWIAAQSPAKRAARVSPIAAVSGNAADGKRKPHRAKALFFEDRVLAGCFPCGFGKEKPCS